MKYKRYLEKCPPQTSSGKNTDTANVLVFAALFGGVIVVLVVFSTVYFKKRFQDYRKATLKMKSIKKWNIEYPDSTLDR